MATPGPRLSFEHFKKSLKAVQREHPAALAHPRGTQALEEYAALLQRHPLLASQVATPAEDRAFLGNTPPPALLSAEKVIEYMETLTQGLSTTEVRVLFYPPEELHRERRF